MTGDCFLHVRAFMFIISLTLVHKNTLCSLDKYMLASFLFPLSSRWRICRDNSSLQPRNKKHWLTSSRKKETDGTKKRKAWGRSWRWVNKLWQQFFVWHVTAPHDSFLYCFSKHFAQLPLWQDASATIQDLLEQLNAARKGRKVWGNKLVASPPFYQPGQASVFAYIPAWGIIVSCLSN